MPPWTRNVMGCSGGGRSVVEEERCGIMCQVLRDWDMYTVVWCSDLDWFLESHHSRIAIIRKTSSSKA